MTTDNRENSPIESGVPGAVGNAVLTLLLPSRHREAIVGDLIEEAETLVLPRDGSAAARRWFWRQAIASASPLYHRQTTREVLVSGWRWLTLMLLFIAGLIMALDPYVFTASPPVIALVILAITVPAAAGMVSSNLYTLVGAAGTSALLLLAARLVSGLEIRWYAMAFMLFVILNLGRICERRLGSA